MSGDYDVSYSTLPPSIPDHDKVSLKVPFAPFDLVHNHSLPLVAYITPSTGLPGDIAFSSDEIESCVADISTYVRKMVERHDQLVGQLNSNEEFQAGSRLPCHILAIAGFIVTQEKLKPFRATLRDWLLSRLDASQEIARSSKLAIKHIIDSGLNDEIMESLKRSIQLTEEVRNILKPDKKINKFRKWLIWFQGERNNNPVIWIPFAVWKCFLDVTSFICNVKSLFLAAPPPPTPPPPPPQTSASL